MKINVGRLIHARRQAGLNRIQAAKMTGIQAAHLGAIEQSLQEPSAPELDAMLAAYKADKRFILMQPPFEAANATEQPAI